MNTQMFPVAILKFRHHFLRALRTYFDNEGFLEIETPFLIRANTPDPHIDPIHAALRYPYEEDVQLRTSPEIWLKKALTFGLPRIYELGRVFRDDPVGRAHNKEFTMVEWYRTEVDLDDLLRDCTQIFAIAAEKAHEVLGHPLKKPESFKIQSVAELFSQHANIDLNAVLDAEATGKSDYFCEILKAKGEYLPSDSSFADAFFHIMVKYVEPNLSPNTPTVITRWPVQLAALAASYPDDTRYCGRFEIYYQGLEIANAYQECTDKKELLRRFTAENELRKKLGKSTCSIDFDFLNAIDRMPKTAGIALGIDRLLQSTLQIDHLSGLIFGFLDQKI